MQCFKRNLSAVRELIIFAFVAAVFTGCASSEIQNLSKSGDAILNPQASVFVAIPIAPSDPDYASTGQYVATAISEEFSKHGVPVSIADQPATNEANLAAAQKQGADYLIIPVITNWQHNATQWSFNPSTMGLRIAILNVSTGTQIRVDNIESRSRHLSFFGTDPKELLKDMLEDYVNELYQ